MFITFRSSQLVLRISCALAFFWFGLSAFMQPQSWADTWMPSFIHSNLVILFGIVLVLVAASLATGFFMRWFAGVGVVLIGLMAVAHRSFDTTALVLGIIGALIALSLWPERTYS